MRKAYQTDLSDAEWSCLKPHLPAPKAYGRPRLHSSREILDAILYVLKSGCVRRLLPYDFPPWRTVYHYFRAWRLSGVWERMHSAPRERVRLERNPQLGGLSRIPKLFRKGNSQKLGSLPAASF